MSDSNLLSPAPNQPVQIDNISNNVNAKEQAFKQWLQNCGIAENDQGAVREFFDVRWAETGCSPRMSTKLKRRTLQKQKPIPVTATEWLLLLLLSLALSYFHVGQPPEYRRRSSVSQLSSGWVQCGSTAPKAPGKLLGVTSSP